MLSPRKQPPCTQKTMSSWLLDNSNGKRNHTFYGATIVIISFCFVLVIIQSRTYPQRTFSIPESGESVPQVTPDPPPARKVTSAPRTCALKVDNQTLHRTLSYLVQDLQTSEQLARTEDGKPTQGIRFLDNYTNPCWLEELPRDHFTYPPTKWKYLISDGMVSKVQRSMMPILRQRQTVKRAGFKHGWRVRCLPYLYIIGMHKAGTTDLYRSIASHPLVTIPPRPEPQFWSRLPSEISISKYLDLYDLVSERIRQSTDESGHHAMITMDGSSHTYEGYYREWPRHPWNNAGRQCITLPQHLTHISPRSKYLLIIRKPESWIVSCVNYFYKVMAPLGSYSSETLHRDIEGQIKLMNECISDTNDLRYCTYKMAGMGRCNLAHMMYYVWVKLWVDTVGRHRIFVVTADVYYKNRMKILGKVFPFIGLPPLSETMAVKINNSKPTNSGGKKKVTLLTKTKRILLEFLAPWNKELAEFLSDPSFLWTTGNTTLPVN